jgi:putative Ca2+/H+ antiporter (TMEM165/GDT1 family)
MLGAFFAAYVAVFIAEIVGDKLLYTSGVLATRFRWGSVISGMSLAFMAKMAVAVAVGASIGELLQPWLVATLTALGFVGVVVTLWRQPDVAPPGDRNHGAVEATLVSFSTIFLAEWGDKGMVTAGALAAVAVSNAQSLGQDRTMVAVLIWAAAVLAMLTKGSLAVTVGVRARRWIAARLSPRHLRYVAIAALVLLGVLSVLEVMGILVD